MTTFHTTSVEELAQRGRIRDAAPDLYDSLSEILAYDGGAANALEDLYVMDRARAALTKARATASPSARAADGVEGAS